MKKQLSIEKNKVLAQLKEHIFFLQGIKPGYNNSIRVSLGAIDNSFPNKSFPIANIHEFMNDNCECAASTKGFISYIIGQLMKNEGVCIWISSGQTVFASSLKQYSIHPERIFFITINKEKEILWVMEEALKCDGLSAVVCEIKKIDFTESRRLQLAVEKSKVTGFVIRNSSEQNINACVSRWRISSLPSVSVNGLPGVGFPRWNIELLKIRNGKTGSWQMEYAKGNLYLIIPILKAIHPIEERKIV